MAKIILLIQYLIVQNVLRVAFGYLNTWRQFCNFYQFSNRFQRTFVSKKLISCFHFISGQQENIRAFSHVSKFCCKSRQLFSNKPKYPIKGIQFEKYISNGENNRGVVRSVLLKYIQNFTQNIKILQKQKQFCSIIFCDNDKKRFWLETCFKLRCFYP